MPSKQRKQARGRAAGQDPAALAAGRQSSTPCTMCPEVVTYPVGGASAALSQHYTSKHLPVVTGAAQPA